MTSPCCQAGFCRDGSCVCLCVLQEVAQQLLPLVAPAVLAADGRFGIVGHSMGCWMAFEMMLAFRQAGRWQ